MALTIGCNRRLFLWMVTIVVFGTSTWATTETTSKKGFLLTSPKVLIAGSKETLCLSLYGITSDGVVNVTLTTVGNRKSITDSVVIINNGKDICFKILIPSNATEKVELHIDGHFNEDSYKINGQTTIAIDKTAPMTFIQTDKPMYKPGQLVKFRILRLDVNLMPIIGSVDSVWIEDPTGIRVTMWKKPESEQGLIELSLQLSDEPPLGNWTITAQKASIKETKKFIVNEYVLPKFSVDITSPPCIVPSEKTSKWKVCAKYSYGQPVLGNVNINVQVNSVYGGISSNTYSSNLSMTSMIYGCHDVKINRSDLGNLESQGWNKRVHFTAEVIEKGTEIKMNATRILRVLDHPYHISMTHKKYFKPGLNFYGTAFVSFVDGRPAPNETLTISIQTFKKHGITVYSGSNDYKSDANGKVHFTVAPQTDEISRLRIKAIVRLNPSGTRREDDRNYGNAHYSMINGWRSPSNSFLQVEPTTDNDKPSPCNSNRQITISSKFPKDIQGQNVTINYQVLARGELLFQNKLLHKVNSVSTFNDNDSYVIQTNETSPNSQEFQAEILNIELDIKTHMSPASYMLVFYVRPDGEVVSDYTKINVENCFDNKVEMSFSKQEILPGTQEKLQLKAEPQSLCALSAVDQSVYLLYANNQLNPETVFSKLTSLSHTVKFKPYEIANDPDRIQCVPDASVPYNRHGMLYEAGSAFKDAMEPFMEVGVAVISDLTLITRPCTEFRPIWYRGRKPRPQPIARKFRKLKKGLFARSGSVNYRTIGIRGLSPMASPVNFNEPAIAPPMLEDLNERRNQPKSETSRTAVIAKPAVEIRNFFPETWLWELHRIGKDGKLKIERPIPHSVTTWTASMFCTSSDKGLGISIPTSIRSFQPFFLSYTMPYSVKNGELVPLKVSIFNYLSQCFTVKIAIEDNIGFEIRGSRVEKACVCGHQSHTHTFLLRPMKIGHLNVTVHAHSIGRQNTTSLCPEGTHEAVVTAHDAITKLLLVKAQGFPKEIVNATMFCPSDNGGLFSNLYTLVLPHNVVEGSARGHVKVIGDLMGPSITGIDKLIKLPTGCGEQNMVLLVPNIVALQYLTHTDQLTEDVKQNAEAHLKTGYQRQLTYRHKDGSYSAFGKSDKEGSMWLTAFVLKSFAQARRFTFIDDDELDNAMTYIKKHQMENGCFESKGRVLHKAMQGGLEGGQSSAMQSLTAYVTIALLEAGMPPLSDAVKNAFLCLDAESQPEIYLLALKTYALALSGSKEGALKNWRDLETKSINKDGMMHWEIKGKDNSHAVGIEITSYALLALTAINRPETNLKALSIVKWLAQQRNANGGFVSTQDTVVAMQALAKYASNVANKSQSIDIEVKIETDDLDDTIHVTEENRLVMQTRRLSHFPTVLDVEATGSGCALLEVTLKYNVKDEKFLDAFALEADVDCDKEKIHICTNYMRPDGKSNMAVVKVDMLSGYEAYKTKLDELKNDEKSPVKRAEINDAGTVNLYFDELTLQKYCFDVDVHKIINVENVKPAFVTVYDYYQPELFASKYYSFDSSSSSNCTANSQGTQSSDNCPDGEEECHERNKQLNRQRRLTSYQIKRQRSNRRAHPEEWTPPVFEPDFLDNRDNPAAPTLSPRMIGPLTQKTPDCPACLSTFPPNFLPLLCYGDIAMIADVRNANSRRLKLRRNAHHSLEQFQRINRVTRYDIGSDCKCQLLKDGQQILIVGKIPNGSTGIPEPIKFNRDLYIIGLDQLALKNLRRFHRRCQN